MAAAFKKVEAGTTPQFTWTASDAPNSLGMAILTASGTVVASVAAVQSGGGMWYAFATVPDSFGVAIASGALADYTGYPCYLLSQWTATASTHAGNNTPFVHRLVFEVHRTHAWMTRTVGVGG
jgi:hypothetical protein